ncbi:MAG: nuclear transport factor 2 family protein [Bdellovibrionales bacterium]|nr:nuclear transport factor 2 family protein [Bdellovibrionales bacterium]
MNTNETLIRNYYQAFNDKKFDLMLSLLTDDVIHDTNQGGRSQGKKEFTLFMEEMNTFYDERLDQIVVMTSSDEKRASAEFVCHGTYKTTAPGLPPAKGQKYDLPVGCFFDIRGGKIARVTNYYNMNDWLKQVK